MKNSILNLGKTLNKAQQKEINGKKAIILDDCNCFCYINGVEKTNVCYELCPNGSIPGVLSGDSTCWDVPGSEY